MGGRGGSMGGSHGMGGGGGAAKAAAPKAPAQTREQQLLARIKGNPAAIMQMSDQDALDTIIAIERQDIAHDRTQNDTFCQRWLNATGLANEKPEVLDEKAYKQAKQAAKAQSLYHSDNPYDGNPPTAVKTLKQLQNGPTAYASHGVHGSGTYLDTSASASAANYGWPGGSQVTMFLNKHAKVATKKDLDRAEVNFWRTHPKTYQHLLQNKKLGEWGKNELKTIWLTSAGYNAYDDGLYSYKVTYSRKALTICSTIRSSRQVRTPGFRW